MEISQKERKGITNLFNRLQKSWKENNLEGFASEFTDDAIFTVWFGLIFYGKDEIIEGHKPVFQNNYKQTSYVLSVFNLQKIGYDIIVAHLKGSVCEIEGDIPDEPDTVPVAILKNINDNWKITTFHNTPYAVREFIKKPDIREFKRNF